MKVKPLKASLTRTSSQPFFSIPLNFHHGYGLIRPKEGKVPKEIEIPIYLIRHELQSRMLFRHLQVIGLTECYFETFLDALILASLRMWDGTDETYNLYYQLIEKGSHDITFNHKVITRRALKIYAALIKARDREDKTPRVKKQKSASKA